MSRVNSRAPALPVRPPAKSNPNAGMRFRWVGDVVVPVRRDEPGPALSIDLAAEQSGMTPAALVAIHRVVTAFCG